MKPKHGKDLSFFSASQEESEDLTIPYTHIYIYIHMIIYIHIYIYICMYVYDANFYHKIPDIPVIFLNPSIELTPVLVAKDLFDRALQAPKEWAGTLVHL